MSWAVQERYWISHSNYSTAMTTASMAFLEYQHTSQCNTPEPSDDSRLFANIRRIKNRLGKMGTPCWGLATSTGVWQELKGREGCYLALSFQLTGRVCPSPITSGRIKNLGASTCEFSVPVPAGVREGGKEGWLTLLDTCSMSGRPPGAGRPLTGEESGWHTFGRTKFLFLVSWPGNTSVLLHFFSPHCLPRLERGSHLCQALPWFTLDGSRGGYDDVSFPSPGWR